MWYITNLYVECTQSGYGRWAMAFAALPLRSFGLWWGT